MGKKIAKLVILGVLISVNVVPIAKAVSAEEIHRVLSPPQKVMAGQESGLAAGLKEAEFNEERPFFVKKSQGEKLETGVGAAEGSSKEVEEHTSDPEALPLEVNPVVTEDKGLATKEFEEQLPISETDRATSESDTSEENIKKEQALDTDVVVPKEIPSISIIEDDDFSNNYTKYVLGKDETDNLMAQTGKTASLMGKGTLPAGTDSLTFSVTHYHGFQDYQGTVQMGLDGIGPLAESDGILDNQKIEESPLNYSDYLVTGDLTQADFDLEPSKISIERGEQTIDFASLGDIEVSGGIRTWRSVYHQTDKITLHLKEGLAPGVHFSIVPQATWVTTESKFKFEGQKSYLTYNPTQITSRVQFQPIDFETKELTAYTREMIANPDSQTMFEVGATVKNVEESLPNGSIPSALPERQQTVANLKEQYALSIQFKDDEGNLIPSMTMSIDEYIKRLNEAPDLPKGNTVKLLVATDDKGSGAVPFEDYPYQGWGESNKQGEENPPLGFHPFIATVRESGTINWSERYLGGPKLTPQTSDTIAPDYYANDNKQAVTAAFQVNQFTEPLTLLGQLYELYLKESGKAYDFHEGDYTMLIFKVQEEGKEEVTVTSDDETAFSIDPRKAGHYKFTSYAEDHSGNKSDPITWDITIGNTEPELSLKGDHLAYTVDMTQDATIAKPDEGQTSLLKLTHANTSGYKLMVKRAATSEQDSQFMADKLMIKLGEEEVVITSNPLELLTLSEELEETLEIMLPEKLAFKGLTTSELLAIKQGHKTVTLSWELVTDDRKIAQAESL